MIRGETWGFGDRLRIAAALVLVDRFPELAGRSEAPSEAIGLALVARWYEREIPPDIERWRHRFERVALSGPAEALFRARTRRARAFVDRHHDPLVGVNVGPGSRFSNDLAVAAAADACLGGARAVALPWNEPGADLAALVDVGAALGSRGAVSANSADQARCIVEAWGPGTKGVVTVRTDGEIRMRVVNVVNVDGTVRFADYTRANEVTASGAIRSVLDPFEAGEEALVNIVASSPFTSVRLWRTDDLSGAQGIPDGLFELSVEERQEAIAACLATELGSHPDPEAMLGEVSSRIEFLSELGYTRWLIRQIQLGAVTFLPGQLQSSERSELVPITSFDGALADFAAWGPVTERGGGLEIVLGDGPEVQRRLQFFDGALVRHGTVDGLPEGFIEVRIPNSTQHRLTVADRGYQPPLPAVHQPKAEPRSFSWIDMNRAASPGSRKTNCWYVASAVGTYLSTGAVSVALPKYGVPDTLETVPSYLRCVGAGKASFIATIDEAEEVVRCWGPGQHGIVAATLNSESTHMFNVLFDGKDVRFIDGYSGLPGESQFAIAWERIGVCHLGSLDPRFLRVAAVQPSEQSP